jgi:5-hydroxyisourate hydrolase
MATLSTHVLDAALGRPADGVRIRLEHTDLEHTDSVSGAPGAAGSPLTAEGVTDADGRVGKLGPDLVPGTYRLTFEVGEYFGRHGTTAFYPRVDITFTVTEPDQHYHVPVLLSPFAYSTYRGS